MPTPSSCPCFVLYVPSDHPYCETTGEMLCTFIFVRDLGPYPGYGMDHGTLYIPPTSLLAPLISQQLPPSLPSVARPIGPALTMSMSDTILFVVIVAHDDTTPTNSASLGGCHLPATATEAYTPKSPLLQTKSISGAYGTTPDEGFGAGVVNT